MELQIPHCICAKISEESILQGETFDDRKNPAAVMRMEGRKDNRSRSMPRPYPPIRRNTAKDFGIRVYGVPQGKSAAMMYEQFGDLKYKYRNKEFWCRGYYVDTVGKMRAELRSMYGQLKEDEMGEQLRIPSASPFSGSK